MKKLLLLLSLPLIIVSCGENKTEPAPAEAPVTEAPKAQVSYPYEAQLANDWTIGDPQKTVKVLELYRHLQTDDFADSTVLPYFADSITSVAFDERVYAGAPQGFLEGVRKFRSQFKELDEEFVSYVCTAKPRASTWYPSGSRRK